MMIYMKRGSPPRARFRYQDEGLLDFRSKKQRFQSTTSQRSIVWNACFLQRLRSLFHRKSVSRLKAVLSRAHFWYRAQGRGPSLARDTPFLLSAVVIAFRAHAPWIFWTQNRMEAICANHMVTQIHPDTCVARVVSWRWVHRGGRHWYPGFRVVTIAVEPLGQLSLWNPGKNLVNLEISLFLFGFI